MIMSKRKQKGRNKKIIYIRSEKGSHSRLMAKIQNKNFAY